MDPKKAERTSKLESSGLKALVIDGKVVTDVKSTSSKEETLEKRGKVKMNKEDNIYGTGLDIGTAFLVSARLDESEEVIYKSYRDAFYTIKPVSSINSKFVKKGIDERNFDYLFDEENNEFVVTGEGAIILANERRDSVRRPLSRGVISPQENYAIPMLKRIIENLVGKARIQGERCVYSVPAKPVDSDFNITYHTTILSNFLLQELGYDPVSLNEGEAIVYAELMDEGLTGVTISFGAGMANVCVASSGDPIIRFSVAHGGDFIDAETAKSVDVTPEIAQAEKENPDFNIFEPINPIQEAISIHYTDLITYVLRQIEFEFNRLEKNKQLPIFKDPLTIVVSGGTSKPKGFIDKLNECVARVSFPVDIKTIKQAEDPLTAVAKGCMFYALEDL